MPGFFYFGFSDQAAGVANFEKIIGVLGHTLTSEFAKWRHYALLAKKQNAKCGAALPCLPKRFTQKLKDNHAADSS